MTSRRTAPLAALTATVVALTGCAADADAGADGDAATLRLGTLVSYNTLTLSEGLTIDDALSDGTPVTWTPGFEAFVPALEAASAGEIDAGSGGLTNLFTGLAAGGDLVAIGVEDSSYAMGIVAAEGTGIEGIDDLRGATIAVNQGGTGEYLALRALDRAGIDPEEVTLEHLSPIDGISAFQSGDVDAIAVWDQYFATAQREPGATVVTTGDEIGSLNHLFHWVTREFAEAHPEAVQALVHDLEAASAEAAAEPQHVLDLYERLGASEQVVDVVRGWDPYVFEPIGDEQLALIEEHGEDLLRYGLIEELPDVAGAVVRAEDGR